MHGIHDGSNERWNCGGGAATWRRSIESPSHGTRIIYELAHNDYVEARRRHHSTYNRTLDDESHRSARSELDVEQNSTQLTRHAFELDLKIARNTITRPMRPERSRLRYQRTRGPVGAPADTHTNAHTHAVVKRTRSRPTDRPTVVYARSLACLLARPAARRMPTNGYLAT